MKLCIYEVETSLNWGALTFGVFSNTYILNFDQTNWLFPCRRCVRWAAVPEVSSPHSPETHPSRLRSASLLNVHLFSVKRPHPSTNSLWLCLFFSSLLSQVVKWSLSSSTSKLSTRTETNPRWVMFYFYYVVSAELPVEPSSQRMNVENDQQINPGWK